MASHKLTELGIRKAKAGKKDKKLFDGKGLFLLVTTKGRKYWRLKYRYNKKEKLLSFGVWPEISLIEAREKTDQAKHAIKAGNDPSIIRKNLKFNKQIDQSNTFGSISMEWLNMKQKEWKEDHFSNVKRAFEIHLLPDLAQRPIREITSTELLMVLKKIEYQGKYEAAKRARQKCEVIFRYASSIQKCDNNPASNLKGTLTSPKRKKMNFLEPSILPEFLGKLEKYDGALVTKLALKFVILTLARTSEIRFATWPEFDLEAKEPLWRIPEERMKMARDHIVPLSIQALLVLREVRYYSQGDHYVFHQLRNFQKPMSENTMLYAMYRMGYHSRATVHGFRSTASTLLHEKGFNPDVIESLLAHQDNNKVRAAYNRAEYLDERRKILQWWADYLDSLNVSIEQEEHEQDEEKLKMWKGGNLY